MQKATLICLKLENLMFDVVKNHFKDLNWSNINKKRLKIENRKSVLDINPKQLGLTTVLKLFFIRENENEKNSNDPISRIKFFH